MTLIQQLQADLTISIKEKNSDVRDALRLLLAQLKNAAIESGKEVTALDDTAVIAVVRKEIKKRDDSIASFTEAGRDELVASEQAEKELFEKYVPALASADDIKKVVERVVNESGGDSQFGQVMQLVMKEMQGAADGKLVSQCVKEVLG